MAAGCDDFIRKPYKDVEIFEALTKNLGVRFVHGEETAAAAMELDAAILADLPKELLKELEQALVRIDIGEVNRVIDAIGTYNSSLSGFLGASARDLQYGRLLRMIRTVMNENDQGGRTCPRQ